MSLSGEFAAEAGRTINRRAEVMITHALSVKLGRTVPDDEIMHMALENRLSRKLVITTNEEFWCLDGAPFLVTYPMQFTTSIEDGKYVTKATQNYRLVGRPTENKSDDPLPFTPAQTRKL